MHVGICVDDRDEGVPRHTEAGVERSALPRLIGSRSTRQRRSPAAAASAAASVPSLDPSSSTSTSSTG